MVTRISMPYVAPPRHGFIPRTGCGDANTTLSGQQAGHQSGASGTRAACRRSSLLPAARSLACGAATHLSDVARSILAAQFALPALQVIGDPRVLDLPVGSNELILVGVSWIGHTGVLLRRVWDTYPLSVIPRMLPRPNTLDTPGSRQWVTTRLDGYGLRPVARDYLGSVMFVGTLPEGEGVKAVVALTY